MGNSIIKFKEVVVPGPGEIPAEFLFRAASHGITVVIQTPSPDNNYTVEWGDGTAIDTVTGATNASHVYDVSGDYNVKIRGVCPSIVSDIYTPNYNNRLIKVLSLGNIVWSDINFYKQYSLTDFSCGPKCNTTNVDSLYRLLATCTSLVSVDLSGFDASNVTNMRSVFDECDSLTTIDVSNFDTSNVTTMFSMFNYCESLTELDLSGFDTSNVTTMLGMFKNCSSLTELDLSGFDTSNVTHMYRLFYECGDNLCITATNNFTTTQLPIVAQTFSSSNILHPTLTEQTALMSATGSTYNYTCS